MIVGEVRSLIEGAFALHAQGRTLEAFNVYDRLLARLPEDDPNLLYGYGTLLAEQGHYGLALRLLKQASEIAPKHPPVWCNLGMALRSVERYKEAEAAYAKALE